MVIYTNGAISDVVGEVDSISCVRKITQVPVLKLAIFPGTIWNSQVGYIRRQLASACAARVPTAVACDGTFVWEPRTAEKR